MSKRPGYSRDYYLKNKPQMAARKAWLQKHDLNYRLRSVLRTIVQRCDDPRHTSYRWYGGKGIKNFLTLEDLFFLWKRDGADKMKKPTIDRKESDDHYTLDNCRFIEHHDNLKRSWKKERTVIVWGHSHPATKREKAM